MKALIIIERSWTFRGFRIRQHTDEGKKRMKAHKVQLADNNWELQHLPDDELDIYVNNKVTGKSMTGLQ